MSHVLDRPTFAVHRSVMLVLLALAVACGGSTEPHATGRGTPRSGLASSPPSASPSAPVSPRIAYPHATAYADPLERYAYKEAFGRCAALGLAAISDSYGGTFGGGTRNDPASAAAAYAAAAYPGSERLRPAATQGCLDGLRGRG
jgi:hypothetical protein